MKIRFIWSMYCFQVCMHNLHIRVNGEESVSEKWLGKRLANVSSFIRAFVASKLRRSQHVLFINELLRFCLYTWILNVGYFTDRDYRIPAGFFSLSLLSPAIACENVRARNSVRCERVKSVHKDDKCQAIRYAMHATHTDIEHCATRSHPNDWCMRSSRRIKWNY